MKAAVWKNLAKYGLGLGALAYVVIDNWTALSGIFQKRLHPGPFVLAALICVVGLSITFLRWHLLVRAVGLPFSRYDAFRLGLVGYFFNTFLPGSVGGDILKAVYIALDQTRRTVAVATVIVDRAIGLWALALFVALSGGLFWMVGDPLLDGPSANPYLRFIVRATLLMISITLSIFLAVGLLSTDRSTRLALWLEKLPKVGGSAAEFWRACWMYRQRPRAVLFAVLLSLIGHVCWVLVFHLAIQAFETPNPETDIGTLPEHMIIVPVGMTVQALFPAPGGVGGGEAAYGELYHILGKPKANGVAGCLSQRIIFMGLGLIGYLVYTRMRASTPDKKTDELERPENENVILPGKVD